MLPPFPPLLAVAALGGLLYLLAKALDTESKEERKNDAENSDVRASRAGGRDRRESSDGESHGSGDVKRGAKSPAKGDGGETAKGEKEGKSE